MEKNAEKLKYQSVVYDCKFKGKQPFQLFLKNHSFPAGLSSLIMTPELERNDIIRFLDEKMSNKKNAKNRYGFFDDYWGILKAKSSNGLCYIRDINVNPKKRENGLGSMLIKSGLAIYSKQSLIKNITGNMMPEDEYDLEAFLRLENFYKKHGFNVNGTQIDAEYPNDLLSFNGKLSKNKIKTELLQTCLKDNSMYSL